VVRWSAFVVIAGSVAATVLHAQNRPPSYTEFRGDLIAGRTTAAEFGAGIHVPLGYYVRLGIIGAAGVTWRDGESLTSGRIDVIARYLLDPFREVSWAPSFGAGMSVQYVDGDTRVRPYLAMVADVEGPRLRRRFSPVIQLGLGGGARFTLAVRTSRGQWR
jgi:hypothetical protein